MLWSTVWFFCWLHINCWNALEVKKSPHGKEFSRVVFPKKVITALHCWTRSNVSLPHAGWVSEWDCTAAAEHLWEGEGRGEGKAKGGVGEALPVCSAKDLSCRKEEPCQQMPNPCGTCQTAPYPSQSAKIKIIHCLISLTSPIKGCFFPLLGESPCCKIPALISAFNNMCCTSAQKESS